MSKKIFVASTNEGKVAEIRAMLEEAAWNDNAITVLSLNDYSIDEPDEPYETFLENAIHKAKYYGNIVNEVTMSDDSGLCIHALDGFPGVRTKEFLVKSGGSGQAFKEIEKMFQASDDYSAYFQSAVVIYNPKSNVIAKAEAKVHGKILFPPRGVQGFGFDPIFLPQGFDQTMAELPQSIKNSISHRGRALKKLFLQEAMKW
ncbi:MAG: non-canonical purine NTP pyrophosphatase [Epsilonproteobacteria bacterium]|nr:non-canonical purine NTP pyrophosphatase [Campylobacterota bacterium]